MEKFRLEAFSDGVFAIVITLLILDIRFPEVDYSQFSATLVAVSPRILAYVMSFIIIGLYWFFHHNAMLVVKKTDRGILWLNILYLLAVSFIPFPTSLLGRYPFQAWPIIIYGITLIACNAIGYITLIYVKYHPHLAIPDYDEKYFWPQTPIYAIVNSLYLCAILLAHSLPLLSYMIYGMVVIFLIIFLPKLEGKISKKLNKL
jgi:uncharacterized membrane protein